MPPRYTDYIVVVDLEALCWRGSVMQSFPEIIEIGVCKLNTETLEISKKTSYLVKPRYGVVSDFCTELTTITQELLDSEGIPLADALNRIKQDFNPKNRQWASYGDYDRTHLKKQCQFFELDNPFSEMHRNVKDEYQMMRGWKKGVSVKKVCDELNIEFEGTLHRGDDDAFHIAKILRKMIEFQRSGFDYYTTV